MKTVFRLAQHGVLPGRQVVEVWQGGTFVGQITVDDDGTLRVISKHRIVARASEKPDVHCSVAGQEPNIVTVQIQPEH